MSPTKQLVVSRRHIVLVAIAAFGGMITAMLATLAITVPVMSAQANSQLDQQAKQFAQVMSSGQVQAKQASLRSDLGLPEQSACTEGGKGAAAPSAAAEVSHKTSQSKAAIAVSHKPINKHVVQKKNAVLASTVTNVSNNYSNNSVYAVNSFNKNSYNQNSLNSTENNVAVSVSGKQNKVGVVVDSGNTNKATSNNSINTNNSKKHQDHKKDQDHNNKKDGHHKDSHHNKSHKDQHNH
jgi:hypothetical protein